MKGTKDFSGDWFNKNIYTTEAEKYNGLTVLSVTRAWNGIAQEIELVEGQWYTLSLFAKSENTATAFIFVSINDPLSTSAIYENSSINLTQDWKLISKPMLCVKTGKARCRLETNDELRRFICGMKLEHGINHHPFWTPNPTDVYTE